MHDQFNPYNSRQKPNAHLGAKPRSKSTPSVLITTKRTLAVVAWRWWLTADEDDDGGEVEGDGGMEMAAVVVAADEDGGDVVHDGGDEVMMVVDLVVMLMAACGVEGGGDVTLWMVAMMLVVPWRDGGMNLEEMEAEPGNLRGEEEIIGGLNATDENRCIHHVYDRLLRISIAGISTPKRCTDISKITRKQSKKRASADTRTEECTKARSNDQALIKLQSSKAKEIQIFSQTVKQQS
ncbi:hypothetical protein Tco_0934755 [Tanacetum coccineum]